MRDLREPEEAAFETIHSTPGKSVDIPEKAAPPSKPRLLIAAAAPRRAALKKTLEAHFSIQTASSAREAIGLLERQPAIDALIVDKALPQAEVLILTMHDGEQLVRVAVLIAFDGIQLHGAQAATTFSQVCGPPRWRGMTWSMVKSRVCFPQYWQV